MMTAGDIRITVVVPVYKVEPYILDCLESVGAQTMADGVECILVDDCGGDRSIERAEAFIAAYKGDVEFRIARHQRNRGLSAARDTGVSAARGKYVYFLDSDDWITPDCLQLLYDAAESAQADVAIADFKVVGAEDVYIHLKVADGRVLRGGEIMHEYAMDRLYPMGVNKLCRVDYLRQSNLQFKEGLVHEDELWSYEVACTAGSVIAVGRQTYVYRIRSGSITTAAVSFSRLSCYPEIVEGMAERVRHSELSNPTDACVKFFKLLHSFVVQILDYDASFARNCCLRMVRANPFNLRQLVRAINAYPRLMLMTIYSITAICLGVVAAKRRLRAMLRGKKRQWGI